MPHTAPDLKRFLAAAKRNLRALRKEKETHGFYDCQGVDSRWHEMDFGGAIALSMAFPMGSLPYSGYPPSHQSAGRQTRANIPE